MDTQRLHGKVCFLTAAGQGIGRATALAFAAQGAQVIATDHNAERLASLAQEEPRITTEILDALDTHAVADCARRHRNVHVLFSCAGFVHHGSIMECSPQDWDSSFALNVTSAYHLMRAFLPAMLEAQQGNIICVASVASSLKGIRDRCAYGASKAALIGLMKAVAVDTVARGVRCNAICPGTVQTPSLNDRIAAQGGDIKAVRADFVARQPMGRLGTAEEVAQAAVYLASDESLFVTGQNLIIDGGICI